MIAQRRSVLRGGDNRGLSAGELETLPCHAFVSDGAVVDCAVCLEAFEAGDRCRRLPRCGQGFHARCVDPWLEKSRCCPVCRADVVLLPRGELVKVSGEGEPVPALTVETAARPRWEAVVVERRLQ